MMGNQDPDFFAEVFNQKAIILTVFGSLGGAVRAAVLKTNWRESVRVIFVGGAVAFGVGVIGPSVMSPFFSFLGPNGSMGALTASAFLLGLVSCTIVERIFINIWKAKS